MNVLTVYVRLSTYHSTAEVVIYEQDRFGKINLPLKIAQVYAGSVGGRPLVNAVQDHSPSGYVKVIATDDKANVIYEHKPVRTVSTIVVHIKKAYEALEAKLLNNQESI